MRSLGLLVGLTLALHPSLAQAQQPSEPPPAEAPGEADEAPAAPLLRIRVLQHPYDLASFYRGTAPGSADPFDFSDRYPIASFYRAGTVQAQGYSRFWSSGYSGRGAYGAYGRRIGEYGDLFLLAPTFLAPLGPLTGAFLDEPASSSAPSRTAAPR
jgi:hypothetical protein